MQRCFPKFVFKVYVRTPFEKQLYKLQTAACSSVVERGPAGVVLVVDVVEADFEDEAG